MKNKKTETIATMADENCIPHDGAERASEGDVINTQRFSFPLLVTYPNLPQLVMKTYHARRM